MEDIERSSATTLIFRPKEKAADTESDNNQSPNTKEQSTQSSEKAEEGPDKLVPLATFRSWRKLSKRINLWVFKFDPDDPTDLSLSEGGGFPRLNCCRLLISFLTVRRGVKG